MISFRTAWLSTISGWRGQGDASTASLIASPKLAAGGVSFEQMILSAVLKMPVSSFLVTAAAILLFSDNCLPGLLHVLFSAVGLCPRQQCA